MSFRSNVEEVGLSVQFYYRPLVNRRMDFIYVYYPCICIYHLEKMELKIHKERGVIEIKERQKKKDSERTFVYFYIWCLFLFLKSDIEGQ